MEVNVCKDCENYRADGCCDCTCDSWHKAIETVCTYCTDREDCNGCPLKWVGCSNTGALRNQGFVQVATALQTQDGQKWLSGMRSVSDLYHAMGMMIDSEVYDRWLAEEKAKDTRLEKLANLFRKLGVDEPEDVYYEAAGYLMEYKEQRERDRECF